MKGARSKLRLLSELATASPERIRTALLANVDTLTESALGRTKSYTTRAGAVVESDDPDVHAAVKAQELGAKLLGVLDKFDPKVVERLSTEDIEEQLRAHGFEIRSIKTPTTQDRQTDERKLQ